MDAGTADGRHDPARSQHDPTDARLPATERRAPRPGEWYAVESVQEYRRLAHLARRRMIGVCEHEAEDVVSLAAEKWRRISPEKAGVARMEQVVRSESDSMVRSAGRRLARDHNATVDPSLSPRARATEKFNLLFLALEQTADALGIELTDDDRLVMVMLFAGYSITAIEEHSDLTRHQIRTSKTRWQAVATAMFTSEREA